jgi:hypothetical protein
MCIRDSRNVGRQRGVLDDLVGAHFAAVPVDVEAVEIQRVQADLLGHPDEERVVDVEGAVGEGDQAGQGDGGDDQDGAVAAGRAWLWLAHDVRLASWDKYLTPSAGPERGAAGAAVSTAGETAGERAGFVTTYGVPVQLDSLA